MSIHVLLFPTDEDGISSPSSVMPDTSITATSRCPKAPPDHLRDVREVHVEVIKQSGIDLGATHRVGLVRHAHVDRVDRGECTVKLGSRRRPSPDTHRETLTSVAASSTRRTSAPGTAFGYPAPVKPLIPTLSPGRMNSAASSGDMMRPAIDAFLIRDSSARVTSKA